MEHAELSGTAAVAGRESAGGQMPLPRGGEAIELIDPESDPRWEEFVGSHPNAFICHEPGWKRVLEASFPHIRGYYPVIVVGGRIAAALPVFRVRSWLMGNRLVSIPFATLCDPLVSTEGDMRILLDYVVSLSRVLRLRRVELKTFASESLAGHPGFAPVRDFRIHVLSLAPPEAALLKSFDRTCVVQKIHRAEKSGIVVKRAEGREDVRRFYRLYAQTRKRVGVPPQPLRFFEELWNAFSASGKVVVLLALHDDRPVSGLMLYAAHGRVSAEYLGYDERVIQMNPHHLLFWEAIRWARREGFGYFDFGRTSVRNAGLLKFKGHWGTQANDLPIWISPPISAARTDDSTLRYRMMREICRRAPQSAVNAFGAFAYRHLG